MQEETRKELRNLIARYISEGGEWEDFRQVAKEEFGNRMGEQVVREECSEFRKKVRKLLMCSWIRARACPYKDREWVEELIVRAYIYRQYKRRITIKQLAKEVAEETGCNERYIRENASEIIEGILMLVAKHTNTSCDLPYNKPRNFIRDLNSLLSYFEKGVKIPVW